MAFTFTVEIRTSVRNAANRYRTANEETVEVQASCPGQAIFMALAKVERLVIAQEVTARILPRADGRTVPCSDCGTPTEALDMGLCTHCLVCPAGDDFITVTVERDGFPLFVGRVGPRDRCEITNSLHGPARLALTASDRSAFIDPDGEAVLLMKPLGEVMPSAESTQQ